MGGMLVRRLALLAGEQGEGVELAVVDDIQEAALGNVLPFALGA